MPNCSDIKNPLVRDGRNQDQREPYALSTDYIKVDERTLADFLVFAYDYAQLIQYYDEQNFPAGDWTAFFSSISVQIARISKTDLQAAQSEYAQLLQKLGADPHPAELIKLFLVILAMARQLDSWLKGLDASTPLFSILHNLIQTNLSFAFSQKLAYLKGAAQQFQQVFQEEWLEEFEDVWFLKYENGTPKPIPVDQSIYGNSAIEEVRIESSLAAIDDIYQIFLKASQEIINLAPAYLMDSVQKSQEHEPHLALFLSFLRLFQHVQDDLNRMTDKHLNFFFKDVLKLELKKPVPDQAHLIFQLPEGLNEHKLDQDLVFTAGDDATGVELFYKLDETLIANQAQIESFKSIFIDYHPPQEGQDKRFIKSLHVAPVANSADGLGAEIKGKEVPSWPTMGSADMPAAELGIAISSESLLLAEGNRTLTLEVSLQGIRPQDLQQFASTIALNNKTLDRIREAEGLPEERPQDLISIFRAALNGRERRFSSYNLFQSYFYNTARIGGFAMENWAHYAFLFLRHSIRPSAFSSRLSTEKGWLTPSTLLVEPGTTQLFFRIFLGPDDPAIVPLNPEVHLVNYPASFPVWELKLNTNFPLKAGGLQVCAYELLKSSSWQTGTLIVKAKEVVSLLAQNDEASLDTSKPFFPFGSTPKVGSSVYLGSNEIFRKKLNSLWLDIDWDTPPANFSQHYASYPSVAAATNASYFQVDTSILKNKQWEPKATGVSLFQHTTANTKSIGILTGNHSFDGVATAPDVESLNVRTQQNFLRLQLKPRDFLHGEYLPLFVQQNTALAKFPTDLVIGAWYKDHTVNTPAANDKPAIVPVNNGNPFQYNSTQDTTHKTNWEVVMPNEPYTPVIKGLKVRYTSITTHEDWQVFHLHPFEGYASIEVADSPALLPQLEEEGALLLGIRNLSLSSVLPLLFQVAEGTANPDVAKAEICWSHLWQNQWLPFEDFELLSDTSNGLIEPGIAKLEIPDEAPRQNTILPDALYWIKISVKERSAAICELIAAHTQSARVTFADQGNDPTHLEKPLPAQTIADLVQTDPQVESMTQAYDSFGGRPLEKKEVFYTRVSERLRHKGRAITIFDYERLILESFPEIYKVKCINHTREDQELMPGHITIALIPNLTQKKSVDRLQPKVSINLLEEIKAYLQQLSSPFVSLHVLNPKYEQVSVKFRVQFRPGKSKGFYTQLLQQDIVRFLSPWAFEEGSDIVFGGRMFRSSILNFVEEQSYVDYLTDFEMFHNDSLQNVSEISSSSARSILVSGTHTILPPDDNPVPLPTQSRKGLGYMRVSTDFTIKDS